MLSSHALRGLAHSRITMMQRGLERACALCLPASTCFVLQRAEFCLGWWRGGDQGCIRVQRAHELCETPRKAGLGLSRARLLAAQRLSACTPHCSASDAVNAAKQEDSKADMPRQ